MMPGHDIQVYNKGTVKYYQKYSELAYYNSNLDLLGY